MRRSIRDEIDATRDAVSRITCWCLAIALHQEFGVGAKRQNRIAECVQRLQEINTDYMAWYGTAAADEQRISWLPGGCPHDFRVPVRRRERGRREEQLRIAGDDAATISWQLWAAGCAQVLGYGGDRLQRLHKLGWQNYEQFNGWAAEDEDYAVEKLKRCAEAALREEMLAVDSEYMETERKDAERQMTEQLARTIDMRARGELARKTGNAALNMTPERIEQIAEQARAARDMQNTDKRIGAMLMRSLYGAGGRDND